MTPADWVILAVVALALCAALYHVWKNRGKSCCGGCDACPHSCTCKKSSQEKT